MAACRAKTSYYTRASSHSRVRIHHTSVLIYQMTNIFLILF
jgi:hypothetical protein